MGGAVGGVSGSVVVVAGEEGGVALRLFGGGLGGGIFVGGEERHYLWMEFCRIEGSFYLFVLFCFLF